MNEIGFIGDIHGCIEELDELVTAARSRTSHLVFLGDYVNRGPHSREVIDFLIRLQQTKGISTSFIMGGNHDQAFLDSLVGDGFDSFLRIGGEHPRLCPTSVRREPTYCPSFGKVFPPHTLTF